MSVLVDSSVWIAYFRGEEQSGTVDFLIDENLIVTNDLILAELLPVLVVRRQKKLAGLLSEIPRLPLEINWEELIGLQVICIKNGINKVGLSDLIIAQNAKQHRATLYSLDKHFKLIAGHFPLSVQQ
jgi:predicted nucleic acid-binding protein